MSLQVLCFAERNSASMLTCVAVVRIRIPEGNQSPRRLMALKEEEGLAGAPELWQPGKE